jgi:hypothetical protein
LPVAVIHARAELAFDKRDRDLSEFEGVAAVGGNARDAVEVSEFPLGVAKNELGVFAPANEIEPFALGVRRRIGRFRAKNLNFRAPVYQPAKLGFRGYWEGFEAQV